MYTMDRFPQALRDALGPHIADMDDGAIQDGTDQKYIGVKKQHGRGKGTRFVGWQAFLKRVFLGTVEHSEVGALLVAAAKSDQRLLSSKSMRAWVECMVASEENAERWLRDDAVTLAVQPSRKRKEPFQNTDNVRVSVPLPTQGKRVVDDDSSIDVEAILKEGSALANMEEAARALKRSADELLLLAKQGASANLQASDRTEASLEIVKTAASTLEEARDLFMDDDLRQIIRTL